MKSKIAFLIVLCVFPMFVAAWQIGVEIEPLEACLAGAAWRVIGTDEWHESGGGISCESEECTIECREINGWQQPNSWNVKRPSDDDTYLNVSYSKLRNRYTLSDYQLVVSLGSLERVLHLVSESGAVEGYAPREDISLGRVFEEDAWLVADGYALEWDARPFASVMVWNLSIHRELAAVRWNPELLPEGAECVLEGMGRHIDMQGQSEAALLEGEYTVTMTMPGLVEEQHILQPGWNLLSTNLLLEKAYHRVLCDKHAFCYDTVEKTYIRWNEYTQENIFWLFSHGVSVLTLKGLPLPPSSFIDAMGWSLVSVEEETILPDECLAWDYIDGKYRMTYELRPGRAYWLWNP